MTARYAATPATHTTTTHGPQAWRSAVSDLGPLACGTTITYVDGRMVDGQGHPIAIAHDDWIGGVLNTMQRVRNLHRCHPEGIVPVCVECGRVWPCPTIQAIDVA